MKVVFIGCKPFKGKDICGFETLNESFFIFIRK